MSIPFSAIILVGALYGFVMWVRDIFSLALKIANWGGKRNGR